jgi:hypothetical protein
MSNVKSSFVVGIALCGLSAVSCGSSSSTPASDGGAQTVAIVSPLANASISTATSTDVPVMFTVTNFTLDVPQTGCGGVASDTCGHVHLLIDGTACNGLNLPYNNAFPNTGDTPPFTASPATVVAHLALCPMTTGTHTMVVSLHRTDHSAITNNASSTVTITAN